MTKTRQTRLEIKSWDEKPYQEFADGSKLSTADVALAGTGDGLESASFRAVLYYRADGTSAFVAQMHIVGTLDGRSGSFVLQGDGTYDGTSARGVMSVVAGSGTDGLAGLRGSSESVSTHDDYPFMPLTLTYELE
jgi:hypothetical protein